MGDKFYIIEQGRAYVYKNQPDGTRKRILKLGPTDYFGELSLLREEPRAATVYTKAPTTVLELSKERFIELMGDIHEQLA